MSDFVYIIVENNIPISYARTIHEARRECVKLARAFIQENERPLWLGEPPKKTGKTLYYANPGPDDSTISAYNVTASYGWFSSTPTYSLNNPLYQIKFQALKRSTVYKDILHEEKKKIDIVYEAKQKKERPNDTPFNQILNEIEKYRKRKNPPAPPPLPLIMQSLAD